MHLIQILLPLRDNNGNRIERSVFSEIKAHLTDRFGGVTAYSRAPAEGRWLQDDEEVEDEIVVYEVMTGVVDMHWWGIYRQQLEGQFRQQEIIVRALPLEIL